MKTLHSCFILTLALGITANAADQTAARLNRATAIFAQMMESEHGIRRDRIANADCIAVIPGFKKGAAGVGVGFGRGFISCRTDSGWSSPAAISLETASLGVQLGGEEIDVVVISLDKSRRASFFSDRFTIGTDASTAWGNGKSAHEDPNAQVVFYGQTKGVFAGFGLDGATLKRDQSGDKVLYGKDVTNSEIVDRGATPAIAQPFVDRLAQAANR